MALFRTRHSRLSELMPLFVDCARGCKPVGGRWTRNAAAKSKVQQQSGETGDVKDMRLSSLCYFVALVAGLLTDSLAQESKQNWTHTVRIGAYSLNRNGTDQIAGKAADEDVHGIEVDNDIPGRYESFLEPTAKL